MAARGEVFAETTNVCTEIEKGIYGTRDHYVVSAHIDAPDQFKKDWTDTDNDDLWRFLTEKRYDMMKELLYNGTPVQFPSGGRSLEPLVYSGDTCFLWPVVPGTTSIEPGDIVFCEVQPNDRFYCHLVWKKAFTRPSTESKRNTMS